MLDCAKLDIIKALLGGETLMEHIFYLKKYRILKFP